MSAARSELSPREVGVLESCGLGQANVFIHAAHGSSENRFNTRCGANAGPLTQDRNFWSCHRVCIYSKKQRMAKAIYQ